MVRELHDDDGRVHHGAFQEWRRKTPKGILLTFVAKRKVNLHGSMCQHLGATDWRADANGRNSLTRERKIFATTEGPLIEWARRNSLQVHACRHCVRDGLVSEVAEPAERTAQTSTSAAASAAMEGLRKELVVLARSRSGKLRRAALEAANGTCEACRVDFSKLLNGAGVAALQVHHRRQLSLEEVPVVTRLEDLAVLCASCHALVHADRRNALSVKKLRHLLGRVPN